MSRAVRTEPSEADLRHAWAHCKRSTRTPWPATYEEAMSDPTLSRLVRITAIHPPKAHRKAAAAAASRNANPNPRHSAAMPRPMPSVGPGYFDRKRAAGGDRDDD